MSRRVSFGLAMLVGAVSLAAAPAYAHHSAPANYTGPAASGGTVTFDVSADGTTVTRFALTDIPTTCGTITSESTGGFAITNHAFRYDAFYGVSFSGVFTAVQQASGTLSLRMAPPFSCSSSQVSWTATTTAAAPEQCRDGEDNDGDGRIDHPADPGCTSPTDGDETDPPGGKQTPGGDRTGPALDLGGSLSQRLRGGAVTVRAGCPAESCKITARGSVSVPPLAKVFRLKPVSALLARGATARLKLKLAGRALRAVRRTLKRGKRVRASVTVTAVDGAGNSTVERRKIRLTL